MILANFGQFRVENWRVMGNVKTLSVQQKKNKTLFPKTMRNGNQFVSNTRDHGPPMKLFFALNSVF